MLDAVHPRSDALLHRGERVRVCCDSESESVGLVDHGPDVIEAELAGPDVGGASSCHRLS
jgi:hypothetical protein